jgi:DNA-binding NarL/FixJ family response regulator
LSGGGQTSRIASGEQTREEEHLNSDKTTTTVLVADATRMDCQLLAEAIQRRHNSRVIGCATTATEIISAVAKSQPELAVISVRLQDDAVGGLLALRQLRTSQTRSRVVMLLDKDERELVIEILRNGASGVFCRTGSFKDLRKCIERVGDGQIWVNNTQVQYVVDALVQAPAPRVNRGKLVTRLSKREREVAQLVAAGLSNRGVSEKLGLSGHTVKNYLFSIFEKLGISTRIELVIFVLNQAKPPESENSLPSDLPYDKGA